MDQIRLTCGGCNRRYRLPGTAVGYFRCRHCDLVMAIPAASVMLLSDESEYDVIQEDDLDEIAMDPSTNELVHLTPGSSASFSSEEIDPIQGSVTNSEPPFRKHSKKSVEFVPADAAAIVVGILLVLGGWLTIVLQWLGEEGQKASPVAIIIGTIVALPGIGLVAYGLRARRKLLLPACIGGGLATLGLCGFSMIPGGDPLQNEQIADKPDQRVEVFEPDGDRFGIESQRKKARERQEKLDQIRKDAEAMKKAQEQKRIQDQLDEQARRSKRRSERDREREKSRATNRESGSEDSNPGNKGRDLADDNSTRKSESANRNARRGSDRDSTVATRKLQQLWDSAAPEKRGDLISKMKSVVDEGLDDARDDELQFWEMFDARLKSLQRFEDGKWINLDFRHEMSGWNLMDENLVTVESNEAVTISSGAQQRGAILTSPDMFHGPLSVKATLQAVKGQPGPDGPQIGLAFSAGKPTDSASGGDYVVLFDSSFQNIWTGTAANRQNPKPLSPIVSGKQPVELLINIQPGFLQVIGNNQLLMEKFDSTIDELHSLRLVVMGGDGFDCSFRTSDIEVCQWKAELPPGADAMVEEDWMYLRDSVEEFGEFGWFHYRLALASFGARKFEQAAESARRAVELGISRESLAIIFAMEHELKGEDLQACAEYIKVPVGNCQDLAKAYHAWFVLTHPDASVRVKATTSSIADDALPERWAVERIRAALAASRGDYTSAVSTLENLGQGVPRSVRGDVSKQISAYQNREAYTRGQGRDPFYHKMKVRLFPEGSQFDD